MSKLRVTTGMVRVCDAVICKRVGYFDETKVCAWKLKTKDTFCCNASFIFVWHTQFKCTILTESSPILSHGGLILRTLSSQRTHKMTSHYELAAHYACCELLQLSQWAHCYHCVVSHGGPKLSKKTKRWKFLGLTPWFCDAIYEQEVCQILVS